MSTRFFFPSLLARWLCVGCGDDSPRSPPDRSLPDDREDEDDDELDASKRIDAGAGSKTDGGVRGTMDATTSPGDARAADAAVLTSDGALPSTDGSAEVPVVDGSTDDLDASSQDATVAVPTDAQADAQSDARTDARTDAATDASVASPASYPVGTQRFTLKVAADRTLDVQVWYPAAESARAEAAAGRPMVDFEGPGAHRAQLIELVAAAPAGCTNKTMHAADAPPVRERAEAWPLIAFSHCMDCMRFSMFTVAEQLASQGFVVAAPDHLGGTVYDGTGILSSDFLRTRASDIRGVIDALLDADDQAVPATLRGKLDATRVGAFGHSFGSITTGLVLETDPRVKAGIMIAAPPESVLVSGVTLSRIRQPGLFFEAIEDNSITALGNAYIEANFEDYPAPATLIKVANAGHWTFTDVAGLGDFKPGCGNAQRMTNPFANFTYLDNEIGRTLTKSYVAAFFAKHLLADPTADAVLRTASPASVVTITHRN